MTLNYVKHHVSEHISKIIASGDEVDLLELKLTYCR